MHPTALGDTGRAALRSPSQKIQLQEVRRVLAFPRQEGDCSHAWDRSHLSLSCCLWQFKPLLVGAYLSLTSKEAAKVGTAWLGTQDALWWG